ncbi:hypothetical protein Tco_1255945 [Tanacetum coccineum]
MPSYDDEGIFRWTKRAEKALQDVKEEMGKLSTLVILKENETLMVCLLPKSETTSVVLFTEKDELQIHPRTLDNGCGYFMWKDDLVFRLSSSPGPSTCPSSSPGPSTHPGYSPGPSGSAPSRRKAADKYRFSSREVRTEVDEEQQKNTDSAAERSEQRQTAADSDRQQQIQTADQTKPDGNYLSLEAAAETTKTNKQYHRPELPETT